MSALPTTILLQAPEAAFRVLIVVISRGVGPLSPFAGATMAALEHRAGLALVAGYPAVTAKNIAAELAEGLGTALLLVEDDVLAARDIWARTLAPTAGTVPVRFATAVCRDGSPNTRWHADGAPLYSGTPFLLVPHPVLLALPKPVFVAADYGLVDGELVYRGPNDKGHHSDVHFWAQWRRLEPRPAVQQVGHVACLKHRLNRDTHDLATPEHVDVLQ